MRRTKRGIRNGLVLLCLVFAALSVQGQTSGNTPVVDRIELGSALVQTLYLPAFDAEYAARDDADRERNGAVRLYGRFVPINANTSSHGQWSVRPNGEWTWRLRIVSDGALATELFFRDVHLAPGSRLSVRGEVGEEHWGRTMVDVSEDHSLSIPLVRGASCIVEYTRSEPSNEHEVFTISKLSHIYRDLDPERSGSCEVDVNCAEGDGYAELRDAVVRIRIVVPAGTGRCTGTLMDNTELDCKPYVLTAMHCGFGSTSENFNNYQFFFNYQRAECAGTGGSLAQVLTGCVKRAGSNDIDANGRAQGSDFMLLELNNAIPASFNAYYAGWDATGGTVNAGRCIHHPDGDVKKISTFTTQTYTAQWGTTTPDTHWRVAWAGTTNGHGVTEPGSSGACLINTSKRVIGTLTGGSSCCTLSGCGPSTGPNVPDFFGKFSQHWTGNFQPVAEKLKAWLSPSGSVLSMNGSYNPCGNVGIEERVDQMVATIFPNPTSDRFVISWDAANFTPDHVVITDMTGRLVHTELIKTRSSILVLTDMWPRGMYLISLQAGGQRYASGRIVLH